MKKSTLTVSSIIILIFLLTSCSSLFGPSLKGKTHIAKALDGATQIEKSENPDEKLIQLFNEEYLKAYEEATLLLDGAKADVAKYLDLPYKNMLNLATSYTIIKNKYGILINSNVDYVNLVKDLDKKASQKLFETASSLDKKTTDTTQIDSYVNYIKKAYSLDTSLEEKGRKIISEYYTLAGDIFIKSDVKNEILKATSYYKKALIYNERNLEAKANLKEAIEKINNLVLAEINNLLENGNSYQDYNKASKLLGSLDKSMGDDFSQLGKLIEEKLTAHVLFCVYSNDGIDLPKTQKFNPNWKMKDVSSSPKTILIDYISIDDPNFNIPEKYNYVFIPSTNFGNITYDYEQDISDYITVNSTANGAEQVLYEIALKQDPNNLEAKNALATGTYQQSTTTATQEVDDIYQIFKVKNGKLEKIYQTTPSINKVKFEKFKFIKGSKAAVENKTGANFDKGNTWGEEFNSSQLKSYFKSKGHVNNSSQFHFY